MALQPTLALRQITAALLLLAALTAQASTKSHPKAHKTASHKAASHKAATHGTAYGKTTEAIALADELRSKSTRLNSSHIPLSRMPSSA